MFFQNVYKGRSEFWTYLVTFIAVCFAYILGGIPFYIVLIGKATQIGMSQKEIQEFATNLDFEKIGIDSNIGLLLLLTVFVFTFLIFWLMMRKVHRRSLRSLITPFEKINWGKIGFAFLLWFGFSALIEGASYYMDPGNYSWQFDASSFFPLLLISILLIPIQTSTEELLFRGYMMQGLGQVTGSRMIPLIVTSITFGLMHAANPEVTKFGFGLMMTYYIGIGFLLGLLTVMDDSLELALGIHAANNIFGATMVTFDGSALQTNALFRTMEVNIELMLPVFFVFSTIITLICARKYGWTDWGKLLRRIPEPIAETDELDETTA